jgi:drug/metabolite transporter (DMT)-like permease
MSVQPVDVFVASVGVLLIVAALLQRTGNKWFVSPNRFPRRFKKRPVPVGASLLLGAAMVLGSGTRMIPADHQRVWALWLLPVGMCLCIASLIMLSLRKIGRRHT